MTRAAYWRHLARVKLTRPRRYRALFEIIYEHACRRIVELGVLDGGHAVQMIHTAAIHHPVGEVEYFGFDLFEELTDELLRSEFSKRPSPYAAVQRRLEKTGAAIRLFKGDSKVTLPAAAAAIGEVDFVFIDGGHSVKTIQSDWSCVQQLMGDQTIVLFDDYYANNDSEMAGLGCQELIDQLDPRAFEVAVLEPIDVFRKEWGSLGINMAMVKRNPRFHLSNPGSR